MANAKKNRSSKKVRRELLAQKQDAERSMQRAQQHVSNPQGFQDEEKIDMDAVFRQEQERRRGLLGSIPRYKRLMVGRRDRATVLDLEKAEAEHKAWAEQLLQSLGVRNDHRRGKSGKPPPLQELLDILERRRDILIRVLHLWARVHHELELPGKHRHPGSREEKYQLLKATAAKAKKIVRQATALANDVEDLVSDSVLSHLSTGSFTAWFLENVPRDAERLGTRFPAHEEAVSINQWPDHLRTLAAILETKFVPLYQRHGSRKRQYGSDEYLVVFLHCFLERITHRAHHQELADLLNAALDVSAVNAPNDNLKWNAKKLAMKITRFRKDHAAAFARAELAAELAAEGRFGPSDESTVIRPS